MKAGWAVATTESPSPQPSAQATPHNRKSKLTYNPAPKYPPEARVSRISGSGRFRIIFSADGAARDVQVIQSTGKPVLDQAAAESLRQWKSEPGHEWSAVVPITFKP
jgi:protein TonB